MGPLNVVYRREKRKEMSLEVLISCMNQLDISLIEKSGIITDALMINQCDWDNDLITEKNERRIRKIDVKQRGLSKSRNMAIEYATGDICLICDDDEILNKDYEDVIIHAFEALPQADIIVFQLKNHTSKLKNKIYKLSKLQCLRVCSVQIAFRREVIKDSTIRFDTWLGAGTPQGCGEENKFLIDCLQAGMKIYHYPEEIGMIDQGESTWFTGFNKEFFYKRGIVTRYILGKVLATVYAFYYVFGKYYIYKNDCSLWIAINCILKGIYKQE